MKSDKAIAMGIVFALAALAFVGCASAATIYVPDDYPTIQQAVNAADPGDTIIVRDGIYTENVDVNKRLTIRSENGSALTVVHAVNPNSHVFEVTADYVNIRGFTVKGATDTSKAGIYLGNNADHCNISDNNASNNYYGIWLYYSSSNNITNNTANSNNGEGIMSHSSNFNTLQSNTANLNSRGISLQSSSSNNITNNVANSNNYYGIDLYISSNNNMLMNNNALNNSCGISLASSSSNNITNNIANSNGYGIYLSPSSNNNMLMNNNASNNYQGISLYLSSNNMLMNNNASNNYGGIFLLSLSSNNITNNIANSNNYYGIYLYNSSSNNITNNIANSNNYYGIYLSSSNKNLIYNNCFNNTNNAYDDGNNNIWNSTKTLGKNIISGPYLGGNYWSNYAGEDLDEDGIGDTLLPYNSSGNIQNGGDWLPLVKPAVPANVIIKPETLNLKSKGVFTAFIELPEEFNVAGIDIDSMVCEGAKAVKGMVDGNVFIAKFDREDLRDDLPTGDAVELTVTGELKEGTPFEGSDTIRVIDKGKGK